MRSMYLPVRVSILIVSPALTKSGTCTLAPVSVTAFFVRFVVLSPRTPGSASAMT